jgi:hypothetical protein
MISEHGVDYAVSPRDHESPSLGLAIMNNLAFKVLCAVLSSIGREEAGKA